MLLLTAVRGAWEAGWSVLTHHQHKHTEEEGRRGDEREKRGGGCYIRHGHDSPTAAEANQQDKGQ